MGWMMGWMVMGGEGLMKRWMDGWMDGEGDREVGGASGPKAGGGLFPDSLLFLCVAFQWGLLRVYE